MKSKYDGTTIRVLNWEKYNPRKTTSRPTWFRFENNIATGSGFFGLDAEQKWLWVVIMSLVSQKNGDPIVWNSDYIQAITGIRQKKQDDTIDIFVKFVRLHVSRTETERDAYPTDRQTDEQDRQTDETDDSERMNRYRAAPCYSSLSEIFLEREVTEKVQFSWMEAFPDSEWVTEEIRKALSWEISNPLRRKKNFSAFITRWLTKGWDQRKTSPGQAPRKSMSEILGETA